MAFNFPSSSIEGERYQPTSEVAYVFNGYAWQWTTPVPGPFTLAWTSATTELTNLAFSITPALLVGDIVVLTLSVNSNMSSPFATSAANTIDSAEAAAGSVTFTGITTPLSAGLTYARVNVVRGASNADSSTAPITLVGASAAPWNSADKSASVNLTGSNYIATLASNGFAGVRILGAKSAGKIHVEFRLPAMSGASSFGVANVAQGLTTYVGDVGSSSIGIFSTGLVWANNVSQFGNGIAGGFVANAWCAIEIDFDAGTLVFMDSAGTKGTVYSLTLMGNGPYFLMWASNLTSHSVEINSGQSAFLITPSSGYAGWNLPTDTTAPVLTAATGTKTGSSTATLTVSTNEANGRVYGVASTAAPSKLQIRTGLSSTGAASTYAFNQAVTTTGVQTKNATGLTAATPYTMHYMHEDTAGNLSNVASASAFTTDAAAGAWTSPLDATTPAVWWIDASNAGSLTPASPTNGTALTQVNDLGSGAHNMTPSGAGGAVGPIYQTNILNSKPGFGFDAARDMWTVAFTVPQPFMLVIVWKQTSVAPSSFGILVDGDRTQAAAGRAIVFARRTDTGDQYCTYAGTSSIGQGVIAVNTAYHSRIVFNGASTNSVLNGSSIGPVSPGTSGIVNGIILAGTNAPFAHICEAFIIPYSAGNVAANSATDATNAAAYTLAKWGV